MQMYIAWGNTSVSWWVLYNWKGKELGMMPVIVEGETHMDWVDEAFELHFGIHANISHHGSLRFDIFHL